jgi:hypothetical protein
MNRHLSARRPAENPFRSERIDSLGYRLHDASWCALERALETSGWRGAVVGPQGCGKTTLLEELAARSTSEVAFVRLRRGSPATVDAALAQLPSRIGAELRIFFDGAEQLGPISWRRFARGVRRAGGLIITGHSPGRLETVFACRTSAALLRELVAELAPENVEFLEPLLDELFHRHLGNIRECFRELYDLYAGRRL